jgi:hypothetical protein
VSRLEGSGKANAQIGFTEIAAAIAYKATTQRAMVWAIPTWVIAML